jgi:hypothetical protein
MIGNDNSYQRMSAYSLSPEYLNVRANVLKGTEVNPLDVNSLMLKIKTPAETIADIEA